MISREYDLYLAMRTKVLRARAESKHTLAEAILIQMEELWWKIPREEQELLETCPSKPFEDIPESETE